MICAYPRCRNLAVAECGLCKEFACQTHSKPSVHYGPMKVFARPEER